MIIILDNPGVCQYSIKCKQSTFLIPCLLSVDELYMLVRVALAMLESSLFVPSDGFCCSGSLAVASHLLLLFLILAYYIYYI